MGVPIILWPEVEILSMAWRKLGWIDGGASRMKGSTMAFKAPST